MAVNSRGGAETRTQMLTLSPKDIKILKFLSKVRFASAEQVATAIFSQGSVTTARERLRRLSGGDQEKRYPVYRFRYPSPAQGNSIRIYTITNRGRQILSQELGTSPPKRYFRPHKMEILTYSHLRHALALTSCIVVAMRFGREHTQLRLRECRVCYELSRIPQLPVVPDMWLTVETRTGEGKAGTRGIWWEVDGGTQGQSAWKKRLTERLTWLRSGGYKRFGVSRLWVCYLVVSPTGQAGATRMQTLCRWTVETAKERGLADSALSCFRFATVPAPELLGRGLLDNPLWHTLGESSQPIPLFPASLVSCKES
jgi:hypothetical protein